MVRPTLVTLLALKALALTLAWFGHWVPAAVVFFGPDCWVLYHLLVPSAQGLCRNFTRFETDRPEVWLTIDDGPDPDDTPRILDLLDKHQARATFFLIGRRARPHPELVAEIVRRGHEVGHHTDSHPAGSFWCASRTRLSRELDEATRTLAPLGPPLRWFRPPVGIKHFLLPRALASRGLQCVTWTIRSGDCLSRRPETVQAKVVRQLRPGAIVLMHEGPSVPGALRLAALTLVLEALTERHYRCVIPAASQLR
jgi:peptidoglycan/xylan/chitin deacetylase (PgdA/CDA1 family)